MGGKTRKWGKSQKNSGEEESIDDASESRWGGANKREGF